MAIYTGDWVQDLEADFTCSRSTDPDPGGHYTADGLWNGVAKFQQDEEAFWLWWQDPHYYLSSAPGDTDPGYYRLEHPGNAAGHYLAFGDFEGPVDVTYYRPTTFMPNAAHTVHTIGCHDARTNHRRNVAKPTPKQIKLRNCMTIATRTWSRWMNPADQAAWLANNKTFKDRLMCERFDRPFHRFINVNVPLLYTDRPTIHAHSGRTRYMLSELRLTVADSIFQELTTELEFTRMLPQPSYTVMSLFQVHPKEVNGPTPWAHTEFLGSYEMVTDKVWPDLDSVVQKWPAKYALVEGEEAQVFARIIYEHDPGGPPQNWDVYTWTELPDSMWAF